MEEINSHELIRKRNTQTQNNLNPLIATLQSIDEIGAVTTCHGTVQPEISSFLFLHEAFLSSSLCYAPCR